MSLLCAAALLIGVPGVAAAAQPAVPNGAAQAAPTSTPVTEPPTTDPAKRDALLGQGWQQSGDRLWTTSSDSMGLHLLVAEAKTGYSWRTAATLSEPGMDADQWIGNVCVTGSGQRAVVVYAPRTFTNDQELSLRGGSTAVVDLNSGAVTKLAIHTSLAYFNPGCGAGETAALTQEGDEDLGKTGLLMLDTTTGKISPRTEVAGQVTSATPVDGGFVVADRAGLLKVDSAGKTSRLVSNTKGVPFDVRADAGGGVVFMDTDGTKSRVLRVDGSKAVTTLATGRRGNLDVTAGAKGNVYITGDTDSLAKLPAPVAKLAVPAGSQVSTLGEAAVTSTQTGVPSAGLATALPVRVQAESLRTGQAMTFGVDPNQALTPRWTDTTDAGHTCSVARNDPNIQVYQPQPKQVEWAADMAVQHGLTLVRAAQTPGMVGWNNDGLAPYTPQGMFPPVPLSTGGEVPAQILLGIMGQESNLWQAARGIWAGETGNPLIGNYYGNNIYDSDPSNDWTISWADADCGYGVGQMTDGMRLAGHEKPGETALPHDKQVAIATDYAADVAASLQLLEGKWNQLESLGVTVNNNDPSKIENWFYAAWAYNSGWHAKGDPANNGAYGLGWLNNPSNPRYDMQRHAFGSDPHDFAKPQDWPYEEKVLGFATYPPAGYENPSTSVPFFRAAWWNTTAQRNAAVPQPGLFCTTANDCRFDLENPPSGPTAPDQPVGICQHTDGKGVLDSECWVHTSITWNTNCANTCGHQFIRYDYPQYGAEPANTDPSYPPACAKANEPPGEPWVIDDVPKSVVPVQGPTGRCANLVQTIGDEGSFDFDFPTANSHIDLHQVGGGYGGHYWYDHTRAPTAEGTLLQVTGTWTFNAIDGLAKVMVHLPAHEDNGGTVTYIVDTVAGPQSVEVDQAAHTTDEWFTLGVFAFQGQPKVHLSTIHGGGTGDQEIIWDAAAISPAYPSNPDPDQEYDSKEYNDGSGLCMMLKGNNPANTAIEQRACTDFAENYWQFHHLRDIVDEKGNVVGSVDKLVDRGTGRCLSVAQDSMAVGAALVEAPCTPDTENSADNLAQQWEIGYLGNSTNGGVSSTIVNQNSDLPIGPANGSKEGLAPIVQIANDSDPTAFWTTMMQTPS